MKNTFLSMLAFVLVLLCAVSAAASPLGGDEAKALYDQAMKYYYGGQRDDEKALALLTQAAELGSPRAMAKIGDMYYWGRGVSVDPALYKEWYRKAYSRFEQLARAGDTEAMVMAGDMLFNRYPSGAGTDFDEDRALSWYLKAAEAGSAKAMRRAGEFFERRAFFYDTDSQEEYGKAFEWYQKAALAGDANAMYRIGHMYEFGDYVAQDNEQAMKWYISAAEAGDPETFHHLGDMYHHGDSFLQHDWRYAEKWYLKAAQAGNTSAMWRLGMMYLYGDSYGDPEKETEPVDYEKAVYWLEKTLEYEENTDILADVFTDLYYARKYLSGEMSPEDE